MDGLGSCLLVFFSGGAATALALAARFLDRPDRLAGIFLQNKGRKMSDKTRVSEGIGKQVKSLDRQTVSTQQLQMTNVLGTLT